MTKIGRKKIEVRNLHRKKIRGNKVTGYCCFQRKQYRKLQKRTAKERRKHPEDEINIYDVISELVEKGFRAEKKETRRKNKMRRIQRLGEKNLQYLDDESARMLSSGELDEAKLAEKLIESRKEAFEWKAACFLVGKCIYILLEGIRIYSPFSFQRIMDYCKSRLSEEKLSSLLDP